jgi:hypothetical protein
MIKKRNDNQIKISIKEMTEKAKYEIKKEISFETE